MVHYRKIPKDIKACQAHVRQLKAEFNRRAAPPEEKERIKEILQHLVDIDQYVRFYALERSPNFLAKEIDQVTHKYKLPADFAGDERERVFLEKLFPFWQKIDVECTEKLKELLKKHEWFPISEFGEQADANAWLLAQHADLDPALQKKVLAVLEKLYPAGETRLMNYAFLYDRVAISYYDESKRGLQRYATQGMDFLEDPKNLNKRRKKLGLKPVN